MPWQASWQSQSTSRRLGSAPQLKRIPLGRATRNLSYVRQALIMVKRPRRWVRHTWDLTHLQVAVSPPAGYSFRLATRAEAARLIEVILAAYAAEPAWASQLSAIAERMAKRIQETCGRPDAAYLVVEQDGVVVGVSGVAEAHWTDQHLLTGICVLPAHQRRGLGTYLLGESLHWLRSRGLAEAQVYTERDSVADRKLYPRFGSRRTAGVDYPGAHPQPG